MAASTVTGEDVIAVPGQQLNERELRYLVGLADGETNPQIAHALKLRPDELPFVEMPIRYKLGAKTRTQMIARAFILGVLQARALIVFALVAAVIGTTSVLYFKKQQIPAGETDSKAMEYDIMAGGSGGPAVSDPRYLELINRRNHPRS
jgi:DNA-binding CsgD family transcriptional regulator